MIQSTKRYIFLVAKGFCMGAADIVPGVSGGTMAFILGIYEELIDAISLFGRKKFWSDIVHGKIHSALTLPRWGFLLSIGCGVLAAMLLLAKPLEHMFATNPVPVWGFFFGLMCASVLVVGARISKWRPLLITALIIGAIAAYVIVGLVPVQTPNEPWFLVVCGAIAICAMILPGISGAFLLVILGKYEFILSAVNNRDIVSIGYIGIGAVVGIIAFSQILGVLFKRYHDMTVALLTGLMIGSLRKIWPWKIGEQNMLPDLNADTFTIIGIMCIGALLVGAIEYLAHKKS